MYKSIYLKSWGRILIAMIISFIFVVSVSRLHPITKAEKDAPLEIFTAYLDERIPDIMKDYNIPGANIALVKDGEVIWTEAYGYADLETGRKMTTDTYLRVESISKPVTAWGIMKLAEQGKIDLDSPVKQYLKSWSFPESVFSEEDITVRQLLSHCSGLPLGDFTKRYLPAEEIPSLKDVLSIEAILEQEPGLSFAYSNTGFNLLELLIEEVTGRDFDEYMKQEILIPLGMYSSGFTWSEKFNPAVPFGYDLKGKFVPVYIYPEKGSGGLFSTIGDIAAFTVAGMFNLPQKQQELSLQSINMLYTPMVEKLGVYSNVFESYGLGYYIENLSDGNYAVSHGGQGAGWMTHFHSVPETGDSIVILTNSQRSWPFIAYLLSDWAEWSGLSEVGMSRIIYGVYLLWLLIWIIWTYLLLKLCRFVEELITKQRRFSPFSEDFLLLRIIQSGLSIALIAGLLWCIRQDYLFISSVFPIASVWLGVSILAFAITMLLLSFFPEAAKSLVS